jgi:hypothetical protein
MRRLTLTATFLLVFIAAPAAIASAPVIERSTMLRHFDDFYVCEGFNVIGDFTVRRTAMEFPDRFVIHRNIEGTLTNSATGATLPVREHDVITFYPDGSVQITGEALHVVVPGTGTVLLIAGRAEFDAEGNATIHGRNDDPLVCAALS